jgi:glyoxylase-like metal-dependent hydrolase (beta-lactamase superfamily II)
MVLVDWGIEETTEQLRAALEEMGVCGIDYLRNTHAGGDHTGGNPLLGRGATMISQPNCREFLLERKGFPIRSFHDESGLRGSPGGEDQGGGGPTDVGQGLCDGFGSVGIGSGKPPCR